MTNRWSSLFVTGCLMAALALFGSATALAQAPTGTLNDVEATAVDHQSVLVTWDFEETGATEATKFEVGYFQSDDGSVVAATAGVGVMSKMTSNATMDSLTISDLMPGKRYVFMVRARSGDAADDAAAWPTSAGDTTDTATTMAAPMPSVVDHRKIMVMPGDEMLMVEWEDPLPGHDDLMIEEYEVQFSKKEKSGYMMWPHKPTEPMVTITGLDNGTMYYVQIMAVNDAGGKSAWSKAVSGTPSADAPMPTPALPLFGAFALGAGLLAAGRARLRRREQRRLIR